MAITKGKLAVYSGATAAVATPSGLLIAREIEHTDKIKEQDGTITLLNQDIKKKDGLLESKDQELKKDKAESGGLFEVITQQSEEISGYSLRIESLEEEVEGYKEVVDDQSNTISDLTKKLDENQLELKEKLLEIQRLQTQVKQLEQEQHHMDEIYARGLEGQVTLEQQKEILIREIDSLKQRAEDLKDMNRDEESKNKGFMLRMIGEANYPYEAGINTNKKAQEWALCDKDVNCKVDGLT